MLQPSREPLKMKLARVFDDNLHTRQWHNIADWLIIAMVLLSTAAIFLSTFDIDPRLRRVLFWIDIATLAFFTVEVSLRIWVAPCINPKYKGFKGRLRYCFSFYGAIDLLSTYPFFLQWLIPLPVEALRLLRTARVMRVMRIGRYSKSFGLLTSALREKRRELTVSLQFLIIITVILSLILFFAEHEAQPEVYSNGFISVIWAFAQYIGDPGQFADTPPITGLGRTISCIVGIIGIAIVAVPAGILGAGFTEALEKEARRDTLRENTAALKNSFQRKLDRPSGIQCVPPLITLTQIQARTGLKTDDIIDVINRDTAPLFRLVNTASTIPTAEKPADTLAVEHYVKNRPYGLFIDRGSKITIINPAAYIDAGSGNFSFYLALLGGFNYISRETGDRSAPASYLTPRGDTLGDSDFNDFAEDLRGLLSHTGAWGVVILVSSGALEPKFPTHLHFSIGGARGEAFDIADPLVKDTGLYRKLYDTISSRAGARLGIGCDHQLYHSADNPALIFRRIHAPNHNNLILRIEWEKLLWNPDRMLLARLIAESLAEIIENKELPADPLLSRKAIGYDDYLPAAGTP